MFNWGTLRYYIGAIGLIVLLMWTWGYVTLINSESYAFAVAYVKNNPTVKDQLGEIGSSRPGLANFKQSYFGGKWRDNFNIILNGVKALGTVSIKLESGANGWEVLSATLNLNEQSFNLMGEAK